ncbi:aldo/keto reductase [Mycobacterium sp. 21AC1]|uniref:aldo/keto reductase n=1 Tax=[Mycobacterium] appelbergii TaxID=2939269 RepID=UPI002939499F|nr:aldo/keto reductase [Mycobacterium sp. 21AC1]MDV3124133.1 aldo/keto reductase [Mycobacterium sp. 21AC1]
MKQVTFGRNNGLRVSELCLGTGTFGSTLRPGASLEEARRIVDRYAAAGGTFVDTASNYQEGESEEFVGELLASRREQFVLASKYSRGSGKPGDRLLAGNSRRSMVRSVEHSLRRLKTDYLDMYWAHYDDRVTPIDEIVGSFDNLIRSGKILYGGLSNFPAWRVSRAQTLAEMGRFAPIGGIQVEHSLVERTAERELLPMAEAFGIGAALYSPLGGGFLTGKHRTGQAGRGVLVYREDTEQRTAILDRLVELSKMLDVSPGVLAIAWQRHLHHRSSSALVTIAGPRTVDQLDDYLHAVDLNLTADIVDRLNEVSAPALGVPFDSIGGPTDIGDDPERLADRVVPVN